MRKEAGGIKHTTTNNNNHSSSSQTLLRIRSYEFQTKQDAQTYYSFVDMLARYLPEMADQIASDALFDAKEVMRTY